MRDRVLAKVQGWKQKVLMPVGREVLNKSIAQAIPSYPMMCFMFPTTLCKKISSISRCWWGDNERGTVKSFGEMEGYDRIKRVWWYGFLRSESFKYCPVAEAISEAYYRT